MSGTSKITSNYEYYPNEVKLDNIIKEASVSDNDAEIMRSIITDLEKNIATTIRNMKCANIPYIGNLRINPVKRKLKESGTALSIARKNMTKEEYKHHVGAYVWDIKFQQMEKDTRAVYLKKIRKNNRKKYDYLAMNLGQAYADMFIYSISLLAEVPFDEEWEEQYRRLSAN